MIGLDSKVVVRYLAQDHPAQSARATRLIEDDLTPERPGYVNLVVLAETTWVLRRSYGFARARIATEVERLLQIDAVVLDRPEVVFTALTLTREGPHEFADALIGALNAADGCEVTLSFDRKAKALPDFDAP